jgi:hypothetical protein
MKQPPYMFSSFEKSTGGVEGIGKSEEGIDVVSASRTRFESIAAGDPSLLPYSLFLITWY